MHKYVIDWPRSAYPAGSLQQLGQYHQTVGGGWKGKGPSNPIGAAHHRLPKTIEQQAAGMVL
jgi:hypothetical protein